MTPTKTQRIIFDLLGIKYEYKGEELNSEPEALLDHLQAIEISLGRSRFNDRIAHLGIQMF